MFRKILELLRRDNLQVQALGECYKMLDICHTMVHASVKSLRQSDNGEVGIDIRRMDAQLNSFERDVRRKVMTHLSLGNKPEIASGLVLVSIVIDLERIGDYTKNIYDLAVAHPGKFTVGAHEAALSEIEAATLHLFDHAVTSFKSGDAEVARKLMRDYKTDISKKCRELEHLLVSGRTELVVQDAVALALYCRFLKRISAHSRNLVSSLVNPFDRIGYAE